MNGKCGRWKASIVWVLVIAFVAILSRPVYQFIDWSISERQVSTTSIYATLITVLLALLALAITAYIFLSTALKERRETYEQEAIGMMLRRQTRHLIGLTAGGIVCLFACLLLDNLNICANGPATVSYPMTLTVAGSLLTSLLLLCYTCGIVNYEKKLKHVAKAARQKLWKREKGKEHKASGCNKKEALDKTELFFKQVGDLELLVRQLIHNHKDDYHDVDSMSTLRSITDEKFTSRYQSLIRFRDFLRIERGSLAMDELSSVHLALTELESELRGGRLNGERLRDLSLVAPFLTQSNEPFQLRSTVFAQSALVNVDFSGGDLVGADFSQTRLDRVSFAAATCTEAVFSGAVWKNVELNVHSNFESAVFRETDFNRQKFSGDCWNICHFQNASFVQSNLLECCFSCVDLRFTSFKAALMSRIELDRVCLSYADLSDAILTGANLTYTQKSTGDPYCFPPKWYWKDSQMQDGTPLSAYKYRWKGQLLCPAFFLNLERATLAQACLSCLNMTGSRMANANFSDASIQLCIFDRCYAQSATFQEAALMRCRFDHAMLSLIDFSYARLDDCDFCNANLQDCLMIQTSVSGSSENPPASFRQVNFTGAQIRECRFTNCDFTDALFVDTDLTGTKFWNCNLTNAKFDGAFLDAVETKDCVWFHPPDAPTTAEDKPVEQDMFSLAVDQAIRLRRSVRCFDAQRPPDQALLDEVLSAALRAPSPKNRQPWDYTVVLQQERREYIAHILESHLDTLCLERISRNKGVDDLELARGSVRVLRDAPAIVFVSYLRDPNNEHGDPHHWSLSAQPFEVADLQAVGASVQNLLLTATARGMSSLWICDVLYAYDALMAFLHLPGPMVAAVALGYESARSTPRKSLDEKVRYLT